MTNRTFGKSPAWFRSTRQQIENSVKASIPIFFLLFSVRPSFSKESITLLNGFRLEADSHLLNGSTYTFKLPTGTVELQAAEVVSIEPAASADPALFPAPIAPQPIAETIEGVLSHAGIAQGLPPELVLSVAQIESNLHQNAVSPRGAEGLMQLMPGTAAYLGVQAKLAADNALGGAKYLRELLLKYHGDSALALAAYNAGPGAVAKYRGVPPYRETQRYIQRVLAEYDRRLKTASPHQSAQQVTTNSAKPLAANKPNATN